jgi:predicted membrane protein
MHEFRSRRRDADHRCCAPMSGIAFGIIVVGVGVLWLLHRMEIITLPKISVLWPSILIAVGFLKLLHRPLVASRVVFGLVLIAVGALLQLHTLGWIAIDIHALWPLFTILLGVMIIWMALHHKRNHLATVSENSINKFIVFGGEEMRIATRSFEGGVLTFLFAGTALDLRDADIKGDFALLTISAIFGGAEIRVPPHFETMIQGTPILGGFENKSRVPDHIPEVDRKKLIIKVTAIFGGVEVKN